MRNFVIVLICAVFLFNCNTALKVLDTVNTGTEKIGDAVLPKLEKSCTAKAVKCKADGVAKKADCAPVVKCEKDLDIIYDLVVYIHLSVATAAPLLALGKDAEAMEYVGEAMKAFTKLGSLIKDTKLFDHLAGLIKDTKKAKK